MEKEGEHEYYLFTYHPLKADNSFALKKEFKEYLEMSPWFTAANACSTVW